MKRIIAVLISMLLFSGAVETHPYAPVKPEKLKCSAVILSDIHIETNNFERFGRIGRIMKNVGSAEVNPDVVAFTGDNTMNGQALEWFDFYGFVNRFIKNSKIIVAYGNHDFGNTDNHETYVKLRKTCIDSYNSYCNEKTDNVYYSAEVDGYKFIVLGSEDNAEHTVEVISDEQISWLRSELAECKKSGKPAVVLNHNLIYGKNGDRSEYDFNITDNNDALDVALVESGADILFFCGHSHFGVNEGSVNTEGRVTYINLPSAGNTGNYGADGENADCGIGCYLEIYEDKMILTLRNFITGTDLESFTVNTEER